jgi:hypothetical protein
MLSVLIKRAKDDDQIKRVIPHLVEDGLSILQYAYDTILFIYHDLDQAKNMKLLLCVLNSYHGSKLTSTNVRFFVTEKLNIMNNSTLVCLDAS